VVRNAALANLSWALVIPKTWHNGQISSCVSSLCTRSSPWIVSDVIRIPLFPISLTSIWSLSLCLWLIASPCSQNRQPHAHVVLCCRIITYSCHLSPCCEYTHLLMCFHQAIWSLELCYHRPSWYCCRRVSESPPSKGQFQCLLPQRSVSCRRCILVVWPIVCSLAARVYWYWVEGRYPNLISSCCRYVRQCMYL